MRPAIVSARTSRDFPRQKGQAPEYPRGRSVRRSAPSPQRFTGRPLRAAIMVELFARGVFHSPRAERRQRRPVRPSPGRKLPTPAGLSEPRTQSRPSPPGRDLQDLSRAPASYRHGLFAGAPSSEAPARGTSLSPRFGPLMRTYDLHRVECWILVPNRVGRWRPTSARRAGRASLPASSSKGRRLSFVLPFGGGSGRSDSVGSSPASRSATFISEDVMTRLSRS